MSPRRVAYVIEVQRDGQWWPVAAWWTRDLAREDARNRRAGSLGWDRVRIVDYRPLDEWAPIALGRGRGDR